MLSLVVHSFFPVSLFKRNTNIFMTGCTNVCSVHTPRSVCVSSSAFKANVMKERNAKRKKKRSKMLICVGAHVCVSARLRVCVLVPTAKEGSK